MEVKTFPLFCHFSKEFLSHHEELSSDKFHPKYSSSSLLGPSNGFHSLEEEVMFLRSLRTGDGNSATSSKQSDSMSDSGGGAGGVQPMTNGGSGGVNASGIPYEVLLDDLNQAKRQLLELHKLVSKLCTYVWVCLHIIAFKRTYFCSSID